MVQSLVLDTRPQRTLGKGAQTRERILDAAEASALDKGFAATSIDEILYETGLTKSGFFYHFRDKNDLARALLVRFQVNDAALFDDIFARADDLTDDPLHSFLIGLKLLAEALEAVKTAHPGCLVAVFVHQDHQFDAGVRALTVEITDSWHSRFRTRLDRIAAVYPPRIDIDFDTLARMAGAVVDGGIGLAKSMSNPRLLADQVMAYRAFVRAVFLGA